MDTINLPQGENHAHKVSNILFYVLAMVLFGIYILCQSDMLSLDQMQDISSSYDSKTAVYLFSFLIMLLCALTPVPAELIALTNTFVYSPVEAFFVTWISAVLSAQIGFEFGHLNNIDPCKYRDSNRICRWLNRYGYKALVIMRLIPVVPFFALNICGGIFKLNRVKYSIITALTIIPAVALLTFSPHLFM